MPTMPASEEWIDGTGGRIFALNMGAGTGTMTVGTAGTGPTGTAGGTGGPCSLTLS